jgi:hypothetical protein
MSDLNEKGERPVIRERFFIPDSALVEFVEDEAGNFGGLLAPVATVFARNLVAILATAASPWYFAISGAYTSHYFMPIGMEVAKYIQEDITPEGAAKLLEGIRASHHASANRSEQAELIQNYAKAAAEELLDRFLEDEPGEEVAANILCQCAVLAWSAFEVLSTDVFRVTINKNPKLASLLLKNDRTKRLYQHKEFGLTLGDHGYDLSGSMGDVLLEQCRLDDIDTIRTAFDVIFPMSSTLRESLAERELWHLNKLRNLIVHRAGVVDAQFRESMGLKVAIGCRLIVTAPHLQKILVLVGRTGLDLLRAASV